MASAQQIRLSAAPRSGQAVIGLALALGIVASWLAIHAYAMFVFELTWTSLPFALLMAVVQCWLSVGLFIISHDAMHGSLVPGHKRINGAIGGSLLFLYAGFGWTRMRDAHFDHHKAPGTERDPDFSADHPTSFWPWYATFLRRYFGWRSILFVSTVVTVYWLVLGIPVEKIVLLYGAPAIASSMQLFYFGTFRPHRHGGEGFADEHNARSDGFGVLASLASCFHFGYHHEHHRAPHVPWWAHKYIMHGWGWGWHRDHHEPHNNTFEKNDLYAVTFGTIVFAMFAIGYVVSDLLWWIAFGITCYGVIYTLVHDGLVHQRYFRWVPKKGYAKRLVQAHKLHHATIGKEGGVSFGFVFARDPARLKAELKAQKEAGIAVVRESAGA